jgi:hypothetical protein
MECRDGNSDRLCLMASQTARAFAAKQSLELHITMGRTIDDNISAAYRAQHSRYESRH